jgi:hypothetical protein
MQFPIKPHLDISIAWEIVRVQNSPFRNNSIFGGLSFHIARDLRKIGLKLVKNTRGSGRHERFWGVHSKEGCILVLVNIVNIRRA